MVTVISYPNCSILSTLATTVAVFGDYSRQCGQDFRLPVASCDIFA